MTLRNCQICLNKPVFYSGETVSGKVNLTLEKNKQCTALMLNIQGEAECRWSETHGTGKNRRTVYYRGNEIYFQTFNNLMAEQHMEVGTSDLVAGDHSFDFAFILPHNLPSSMEGFYGYIRYTAKVALKRQYKIDLCYQISFTILTHFDLNLHPTLSCPIQYDQCKKFYFLFSNRGILYLTVKIPFSGYVPGQSIPVICQIKNESKVKVEYVKASLYKSVTYYARARQRCEYAKLSRSTSGETCRGEEKTHDMILYVPPTPTSITNCTIINVIYQLKVTAVVSGMHGNLSCVIPITIGTVPLASSLNLPVDGGSLASTSCEPSAPPDYPDMVLPSYEEAVDEKRMEENFEEWNHTKEFSPKYPVYNFDKK